MSFEQIPDFLKGGAGAASVLALAWVIVKYQTKRLEDTAGELKARERELVAAHERTQTRCYDENKALVARIQLLEDRAHEENREERGVMLQTLQLNAQAMKQMAEAYDRTPPGSRRHD